MEKFLLHAQHMGPNASIDGLCNFEAHRMYQSIDMHQEGAVSDRGAENANPEASNPVETEEIHTENDLPMASDCGAMSNGGAENEASNPVGNREIQTENEFPMASDCGAMSDGGTENANEEASNLVGIQEIQSENDLPMASDCDAVMEDSENVAVTSMMASRSPLANSNVMTGEFVDADVKWMASSPVDCNNMTRDLEKADVKRRASSISPTKNRLSTSSSSSSKRIRLHPSSHSPASSSTSGHSGSTLIEDDTENCSSDASSQGVTLVDGKQFEASVPENVVLCINAGGSSIPGTSFGADFSEDCHFVGGDVLRTGETIAHTKDPLIYQTARYGDFSYFVEDMPPGDYIVDLHFAEINFTNGPPGLRVFDVLVQDHKVVAMLDVYSIVGSNTPLIIMNVRATVKDKGLSISFRGIAGSPSLNGICIRKPLSQEAVQHAGNLCSGMVVNAQNFTNDCGKRHEQYVQTTDADVSASQQPQVQEHHIKRQKSKTRKCVQEYELKIQELKNEVHQAWMSVQDANRQNEKLQSELDCRSLHVDSLAQAVERQLCDLNDVRDKAENEKQEWLTTLLAINTKFQLLKKDYNMLAKEAHEWVSSFPAIQSMTEKVQALVDELEELKKQFVKQGQDLRLYYNQVLELKGNIRVFCRCRPLSSTETSMGASSVVDFDSARDNELVVRSNGTKKMFKFDRIFTPNNNQSDVFLDTAPVVGSVLDGYNVCIFAYGQTGTGKTFTMEGTENDRGVNFRTLEELFHLADKRKGQYEYIISVSVLEVYNEQIRDLLAQPLAPGQSAKKLEIKQVTEGVHHVPGLTEATVHCMEEVWDVLQTGSSARAVGSTNANEHSSRSHCMLCVMVKGESLLTRECTRSKLWLVDLAGSERVAKTDVQGERLKEAQSINKSLSALGDVIYALSTKSSHVPYRNSKLTHLLQDSLGGESKTLMFVQISPSELDAGETLCSLNFASRVRGVELGPARKQLDSTEIVKYKQMIEKFKQDARGKDETFRKQEDSLKRLEDTLKMKEQAFRALSDKVRDHEGTIAVEKKARSTVECKLKEQQSLIEKLREELKSKEFAAQRRALEPVQEDLCIRGLAGESTSKAIKAETVHSSSKETHQSEVDDVKMQTSIPTSPGKLKIAPSKFNMSSPGAPRGPTWKPGRVSLAGVLQHRRRASMATVNIPPPIPATQPPKTDAMDGTRSSSESLRDSFPDENILPHLQHSVAPAVLSSPKSAGWKKGTPIAPSTVLRRSIPRKIHFKSPHLQPNYLKATQNLPPTPAAGDREGSRLAVAERVLTAQNKRDQNAEGERQGGSKMRRVSLATTWGRPPAPVSSQQQQPPWNATTLLPPAGNGAQRVPVSNAGKTAGAYNRERAWNR